MAVPSAVQGGGAFLHYLSTAPSDSSPGARGSLQCQRWHPAPPHAHWSGTATPGCGDRTTGCLSWEQSPRNTGHGHSPLPIPSYLCAGVYNPWREVPGTCPRRQGSGRSPGWPARAAPGTGARERSWHGQRHTCSCRAG